MGEDFSRHREIRFTNLDHWGGGLMKMTLKSDCVVLNPGYKLTSYVTLAKSLQLHGPQFPHP